MALSDFIIRLIFLALPGIVSVMVYRTLKGRPNKKDWEDVLEIALFSLINYTFYGFGVDVINYFCSTDIKPVVLQAIFDDNISIFWPEILITSAIGFTTAFIASYLYTNNLINKLGQRIKVTSMFGNKDVWEFFQSQYGHEWVFVRDHKLDLVYYGYIHAYSDSEKERELILREVDVYTTSNTDLLYKTPVIYISRERDDLSIELPDVTSQRIPLSSSVDVQEKRNEQTESKEANNN